MVSTPSEYKWSSYPSFIGKSKPGNFLQTNWLLSNFGKSKKEAKGNYKEFVEVTDIQTVENPNRDVIEGFILGDLDFVNWIKENFLSNKKDNKEIPQLKKLKPKVQLETIVNEVSKEFGCADDDILAKGRKKNKARELAIHIARDLSGMPGKELGEYFGGVSGALITMMYNRVAIEAEKNKNVR